MFAALVIGVVLLWMCSGPPALMLHWNRSFDLTVGDAVFCTFAGVLLGPFAWVILWADGKDFGAGHVLRKKKK